MSPYFTGRGRRNLSLGVNFGFTHTKRSPAAKEILMLAVTGQSLLTANCIPLRCIPFWVKNLASTTVRKGELDVPVLAPLHSSSSFSQVGGRCFDFLACNCEDHPVTRRDESDITAVELAALHHELAVDPLRWLSSDAAHQQLQGLILIWYTAGTCDQLNLGSVAAMEEQARQIRSHVDAYTDPDNVSWADSCFFFLHWIATSGRCSGSVSSAARSPSNQVLQGNRICLTTISRTCLVERWWCRRRQRRRWRQSPGAECR